MSTSRTCVLIDRGIEAEAVRDALIGRIAQHRRAAADENRHLCRRDVKSIEQFLDVAVAIEIDVGEGVSIPRQELLIRSVAAECTDPIRTTSPRPCATSSSRR